MGAELFWEFFFFSGFFFFFLVGGGFGAVQAPFWENPGVKGRFVRVLGHLGVVLELSRLLGKPVVKCRFHPGLDTKNCFKKQIVPFISVFCVYLSMLMCVCAFVIEYVVCVFFLLLF